MGVNFTEGFFVDNWRLEYIFCVSCGPFYLDKECNEKNESNN